MYNPRLNHYDRFQNRHIGPSESEREQMLGDLGLSSMDELVNSTVPKSIRLDGELDLPAALGEAEYLQHLREVAKKNKVFKSYIGLGYHPTITPAVIQRNILENPGWYTQYTPYQAEIAQGRLEALLNFQTVVSDLCGLEIANASLLDEGTAAAEAMIMFFNNLNKREVKRPVFFVDDACLPQTKAILETKAVPLGIELTYGKISEAQPNEAWFGALIQYPAADGAIINPTDFIESVHNVGAYACMAADILSLAILESPGALGADCAVGSTQRFGIPMGNGGPHAGYFATIDKFKRSIPGRIIGVSIDANGDPAYRMALQTREQHIRREKATSNICTAQALLAIMAGMYAVYHGPEGIAAISSQAHTAATVLSRELEALGLNQRNAFFFDTLRVETNGQQDKLKTAALAAGINLNYFEDGSVGISTNECTTAGDLQDLHKLFASIADSNKDANWDTAQLAAQIPPALQRSSAYLTHEIFTKYHSETELMRYIKELENKDLSLTTSMIALGSCTMKLNAAAELMPVSWPEFGAIHPFAPADQRAGYTEIITGLERALCEITRFDACSLQPNSGAQGEYSGLMVIRAYHLERGEEDRKVVLIPSSAHGTNPASAVMAGMEVVVVACDDMGNIELRDLQEKALEHRDRLAGLMVTYPSTHGVFEEAIKDICECVHQNGGLVYMDGANMNAQVGLTSPADIGADVCHLNLHKTFSIPHGGGGPGMGPICVNEKLAPFLPGHPVVKTGGEKAIGPMNAAPFGSASILLISYGYIRMLGSEGCRAATENAILSANYLSQRIGEHFDVLYKGRNGRVGHEFIIDLRPFKQICGVEVEDLAKRLMDYGFHAPTVSFPVAGTMMIEPTESESKEELDRFCEAMISIRAEIQAVMDGEIDPSNNPLKNAPHTLEMMGEDNWDLPYGRKQAVFPLPWVKSRKFWPMVARINNSHGDRNLICTCPPMEAYATSE